MPFYTAITQEGTLPDEAKARIAVEITRIHTTIMKVPQSFVRVVFISYPKGSGFIAGEEIATAALTCILRTGHSAEDKAQMLRQLWKMFQEQTGIGTDRLAIALNEVSSDDAMEMGQIMQSVVHR